MPQYRYNSDTGDWEPLNPAQREEYISWANSLRIPEHSNGGSGPITTTFSEDGIGIYTKHSSTLTLEMIKERMEELKQILREGTSVSPKTYWKESREVDLMLVKK